MVKVEIFWRAGCGFCKQVQSLMEQKGVAYESYNIWEDSEAKAQMKIRVPDKKSVPQVFINGEYIGGCYDTMAFVDSGALDALLAK